MQCWIMFFIFHFNKNVKYSQGDNPKLLESHFILLCVFIKFKNKKYRGEPKTFQKEKWSTVEVGELLELCSCPWKLCEPWLQKHFNKYNYPLVQILCTIKIMCQDLPLGWLDCLFGLCSAKTKTLAVVRCRCTKVGFLFVSV